MKRILILLVAMISVAQAQFSPTSSKTAFKNGISIGTRDSTAYSSADSLILVINRAGRLMYRSIDGYWRILSNAGSSDYVPYFGANSRVDLGVYRIKADAFDLGIPSSSTDSIGRMRWNADDLTMNIGLTSSVVLQSGQEMLILVKNQTGVTIPNGTVVRQSGVVGASGRLKVEPFLANGTHNSNQVLGVTTEDIPNGSDGFVASFGKVRSLNTSAWPDSTILYASTTVAGGFTDTVPEAPNNIVKIGTVINSSASNGIVFVRVIPGSNIHQDEGVQLINPVDKSLLVYDSASTLWKNGTLTSIGGVSGTGVNGRVAYWNGTGSVTSLSTFTFDGTTVGVPNLSANTDIVAGGVLKSTFAAGTGNRIAYLDAGGTIRRGTIDPSDIATTSSLATKLNISDTATMLTYYLRNRTGLSDSYAIGNGSMLNSTSGTRNIGLGSFSLQNNTDGGNNVAIGYEALKNGSSISNNTAIGYAAGSAAIPTDVENSVYLGYNSTPQAFSSVTNEIVIGASTTGNGSNTVTIGNSSITNNYFTGNVRGGAFIKSGGTSSQFLKADGSVDGNTYATTSALSGYLPLTGGTLTGSLSGTSAAFSGGVNMATSGGNVGIGVTPSAWGSGRTAIQIGNDNSYLISNKNLVVGNNAFNNGTNWVYLTSGVNANLYAQLEGGNHAWYTAPSGTAGNAISFTQAMTLGANGNLLLGTTTDNGTDALQVAGSGLFTGDLTVSGGSGQRKITIGSVSSGNAVLSLEASGIDGGSITYNRAANSLVFGISSASSALTVASTGAATFSSSVTAGGIITTQTEFRANPTSGDGILRLYSASTERATIRANSTKLYFEVGGTERLGVDASTGAATFSSSVKATSLISSGSSFSFYDSNGSTLRAYMTTSGFGVKGSFSIDVFTVATLPAGSQGALAMITDGSSYVQRGSVSGGGSVVSVVYHDGGSWRYL